MDNKGKNIILIGFMGSGKTTTGLKLSYKLHMPVEDTDKLIEMKQGKSITDIFAQDGEAAFRQMETELLREIAGRNYGRIISVGGGMPVREENRALLRQCGIVFYLRARAETIYDRIREDTTRPLLQCGDPLAKIRELMGERAEAYETCADVILDVDGLPVFKVVEGIMRHIPQKAESGALPKSEAKLENRSLPKLETKTRAGSLPETETKSGNRSEARPRTEAPVAKLLVINGPNINFLGIREKSIYGTQDYQYLLNLIAKKAEDSGSEIQVFQSNHEGAIIDRIQEAYFDGTEGIVINPGAYTHYSYAIRDALASITVPKVEIHISDITQREEFRRTSVTKEVCDHQIYGQGLNGYLMAIDYIFENFCKKELK